MEFLKQYILQNWALILTIPAFIIMLCTSIFIDRKTTKRTIILVASIFVFSILVFTEFYLEALHEYITLRTILIAIRYSATPFIVACILPTLVRKTTLMMFIPAVLLSIINIVSIFTGIVFSIDADGTFTRGPLGYLPFIVAGLYFLFVITVLIKRSNKRAMEIIPIIYLAFAFAFGLTLPFIYGKSYAQIFCTTIVIALFVYYVFSILNLTKKDPLTGLLNRQAYYQDINTIEKDITAVVSLDMNGLKATNDTYGHAKGDEALISLSLAFMRSIKAKESVYRVGGDEFIIVCRKETQEEVLELIRRIKKHVLDTKFSCSIGYSYRKSNDETIDEMVKESDEMMYKEKAEYHKNQDKEEN